MQEDASFHSRLGISTRSILADIPNLNIFHVSPPDVMHDIMEGILPDVCEFIFKELKISYNILKLKINSIRWVNGSVSLTKQLLVRGKAIQVSFKLITSSIHVFFKIRNWNSSPDCWNYSQTRWIVKFQL